jgi:hypothetical protein
MVLSKNAVVLNWRPCTVSHETRVAQLSFYVTLYDYHFKITANLNEPYYYCYRYGVVSHKASHTLRPLLIQRASHLSSNHFRVIN